jgi:hypothetical protein
VAALAGPARLLDLLYSPGMPGDQIRRLIGRAARLAARFRGAPGERAKILLVEQVIVGYHVPAQCPASRALPVGFAPGGRQGGLMGVSSGRFEISSGYEAVIELKSQLGQGMSPSLGWFEFRTNR